MIILRICWASRFKIYKDLYSCPPDLWPVAGPSMLRKTTPIGNPSSSDVVGRLDKYLRVNTVKSLATMFTDCYSI